MATSQNITAPSRFHNLSDAALADELGRVDAISKAAETELKALKDEFKSRGKAEVTGDAFMVTATEQIAGRLDERRCAIISARPIRVSRSLSSRR
jgi:hypothetical protein